MSPQNKINVHEPEFGEDEISAVVEALRAGEISGSFGKRIGEFEDKFSAYHGCKYGIAVTSGTTALHLAVAASDIGSGDEVIMSASTNIATALAAYHNGAVTVPVDSEAVTWNLNPDLIEDLITDRTKAILPVHLFGHPAEMDKIGEIARRHNLIVIEDCAEAHGATWKQKKVGSFGDMGCFSFYANKIITTGEGGMIVTNNFAFAEKLRLLRNLAFDKPRFFHKVPGYNFRMTGYQAAMGITQLEKIEEIIEKKRNVAQTYNHFLEGVKGIQTPTELADARNVYWMYAIVLTPEFGASRDQFIQYLDNNGVDTRTFFCPMGQQPFIKDQLGYRNIPCPVADMLWKSGLYLPSSNNLSESQILDICDIIKNFNH